MTKQKPERRTNKQDPQPSTINQKLLMIVVLVALVSFGVAYAIGSRNNKQASGPIQTQCGGTCVALYDEQADPEVVTIATGSYVQFNSADGQKHSLSIGGAGTTHHGNVAAYSSVDFKGDEAWRVQFKQDGTYTFKDAYHPKVSINVVVYTPGKDYKVK